MEMHGVLKRSLSVLVMLLIAATTAWAADSADMILVNGRILTVDDQFSVAQAVAIKGQRVLAVGKNAEIRKRADANT